MLSCQYLSFSLSLRESQGLLNRAVCTGYSRLLGADWSRHPFIGLGGISLSMTPHPLPPPCFHVCLTSLWGKYDLQVRLA